VNGKRVAVLATDGVEQVELTDPWNALREAGADVQLVSLAAGEIQAMEHDEKGKRFPVDRTLDQVTANDYDALMLPGGVANPDRLRMDRRAVAFVRAFFEMDKPVAAICHAPWILVEADVVKGRTVTSWPSLQTDIRNAGGDWVDKAVQTDQRLVTSRKPADLPQFCAKMLAVYDQSLDDRALDSVVEQSFPASDPMPGPTSVGGQGASADAG
jgi:protease I